VPSHHYGEKGDGLREGRKKNRNFPRRKPSFTQFPSLPPSTPLPQRARSPLSREVMLPALCRQGAFRLHRPPRPAQRHLFRYLPPSFRSSLHYAVLSFIPPYFSPPPTAPIALPLSSPSFPPSLTPSFPLSRPQSWALLPPRTWLD